MSCGNTFCRDCFEYQSYVSMSTGIKKCPDNHCGRRHSPQEIRADVTVSKLTELCRTQLLPLHQQHQLILQQSQHHRYHNQRRLDDTDDEELQIQLLHQQPQHHQLLQFQQNHNYISSHFVNDDDERDFIHLERHFENEASDDDEIDPFANSSNYNNNNNNNNSDNKSINTDSTTTAPTTALISLNLIDLKKSMLSELDCQVCYSLLIDPITTPCGHSFCKPCLTRSLDHNDKCPICRHQLRIPYTFLTNHPTNKTITLVLESLYLNLYTERRLISEHEFYDTMEDTPIFVSYLVFPKMPCFLHVFEPKYRLMLRRCLDSRQRHFGMVLPARNGQEGYSEYGTILEIKSAEFLEDGRSLVETIGSYRFRVLERNQKDGYHVGKTERIDDVDLEEEEELERRDLEAAAINNANTANPPMDEQPTAKLISLAREFIEDLRNGGAPWLLQRLNSTYGEMPDDPSDFTFWVASVIPIDEYDKYRLLELRSVRERLKLIILWITQLKDQWWFARGCCVL